MYDIYDKWLDKKIENELTNKYKIITHFIKNVIIIKDSPRTPIIEIRTRTFEPDFSSDLNHGVIEELNTVINQLKFSKNATKNSIYK